MYFKQNELDNYLRENRRKIIHKFKKTIKQHNDVKADLKK